MNHHLEHLAQARQRLQLYDAEERRKRMYLHPDVLYRIDYQERAQERAEIERERQAPTGSWRLSFVGLWTALWSALQNWHKTAHWRHLFQWPKLGRISHSARMLAGTF